MLSGFPKTIGETEPIPEEKAREDKIFDRVFWYQQNVKYFVKDGEERLGFGHGDIRNYRDYLREVRKGGNETEYLALMAFIANERNSRENKFNISDYGFKQSELRSNMEALDGVIRVQKLKKIAAEKEIPIDPTDYNYEKQKQNRALLLELLANREKLGGEKVVEKVLTLIFSCFGKEGVLYDGDTGILPGHRGFIQDFFMEYVNSLDLVGREKALNDNIEKANLSELWMKQMEALAKELTTGFSWKSGAFHYLMDREKFFSLAGGKNFIKMFFQATLDFLPIKQEDYNAFELTSQKFVLCEKVFSGLRAIEDQNQRFEEAKKIVETVGADVVLGHIYELALSPEQEEKLLAEMAAIDPESFVRHAKYIDFSDLKNRQEVYRSLLAGSPGLFINHLNELQIKREEAQELLFDAAKKQPLAILANFDLAIKNNSAVGPELMAKIKAGFETIEYTDVEILNELTDVKVKSLPEAGRLIADLRRKAIVGLSDSLMKRIDFGEEAVYSKKEKSIGDGRGFLGDLGLRQAKRDILEYTFSRTINFSSRISTSRKKNSDQENNKREYPPATIDAVVLILRELLENQLYYMVGALIQSLDVNEADSQEQKEIKEIIKEALSVDKSMFFRICKSGWLGADEQRHYLDGFIEEDAVDLMSYGDGAINLQEILSDQQKTRIIELLAENSPSALANNYYRLRVSNGKTEYESVRQYIEAGKAPFCFFKTPAEAINFLSKEIHGFPWNEEEKPERLIEAISLTKKVRSINSPEIMKILEDDRTFNFRISNERKLLLMDKFIKKYQSVFDSWIALDEKNPYGEWLTAFSFVTDEGDFPRLAENMMALIDADKDCQKEQTADDKYAGKVGRIFGVKYWPQEKLDMSRGGYGRFRFAARGRKNVSMPLYSFEYGTLIGLSVRTGSSYQEMLKRLKGVEQIINQDVSEKFHLMGFVRREADESLLKFKFLRQNGKKLNDLALFMEKHRAQNFDEVAKKIFKMETGERDAFFSATDWSLIIKGFEAADTLDLYLKYCGEGLLRPSEKENVKIFREYLEVFGLLDSRVVFEKFLKLRSDQEPDEELKEIGVDASGAEGLRQLKDKYYELRDLFILRGEFNEQDWDLENKLCVELLAAFSDCETSRWGRDDGGFKKLAQRIVQAKRERKIIPLDKAFVPQKISVAELVDFNAENVTLSEGAVSRYRTLLGSSAGSYLAFRSNEEQQQWFLNSCLNNIENELQRLQEKLMAAEKITDDKAIFRQEGLKQQIELMRRLASAAKMSETPEELLRVLLDFETMNNIKNDHDVTTPIIRNIVFMRARAEHEDYFQEFSKMSVKFKPKKGDFEKMAEFVSNILKQHVCPGFDLPAEQSKKLSKILNVSELKKEAGRLGEMQSGKKSEVLCVPSRELLGELSGYYCDACWAGLDDIMEKNPKMTAVAFVSSPEDRKHRRLAGATLLIETAVNGQKAMIIRGINPKQNFIEQISAENFVEEFIEKYLLPICRAQGIKLILTPLHNKGALTNRSAIEEYLNKKYQTAEKVNLDETINFNGYDITKSCVILRNI